MHTNDGCRSRRLVTRARISAVVLCVALLWMVPVSVDAASNPESDPFDRPGFYVGAGGTYQFNAFNSRIEDVIQDEVDDALPGANSSFNLEDSGGANVLLGYRIWSWFALELQYEWVDEYDIKGSVEMFVPLSPPVLLSGKLYSIEGHTLTVNTKWIIPFWRIQPYLLIGGGVAMSDVSKGSLADEFAALSGADIDDGTDFRPAARAGLGLDLYVTKHIVVNAQASAVLTTLKNQDIGDVDDLNYMSFIAGLQYRF